MTHDPDLSLLQDQLDQVGYACSSPVRIGEEEEANWTAYQALIDAANRGGAYFQEAAASAWPTAQAAVAVTQRTAAATPGAAWRAAEASWAATAELGRSMMQRASAELREAVSLAVATTERLQARAAQAARDTATDSVRATFHALWSRFKGAARAIAPWVLLVGGALALFLGGGLPGAIFGLSAIYGGTQILGASALGTWFPLPLAIGSERPAFSRR